MVCDAAGFTYADNGVIGYAVAGLAAIGGLRRPDIPRMRRRFWIKEFAPDIATKR
jgi:hypothetical protein